MKITLRQFFRGGLVVPQVHEGANESASKEADYGSFLVRWDGNFDGFWCEKHELDSQAQDKSRSATTIGSQSCVLSMPRGSRTLESKGRKYAHMQSCPGCGECGLETRCASPSDKTDGFPPLSLGGRLHP